MQQEEQFGVFQTTHCAATPVANRQALTFELKLSLKPGAGRDYVFSEAVFDQCCGADLCRWKKLLLLSERTLEQSNLDLGLHLAQWDSSQGYMGK